MNNYRNTRHHFLLNTGLKDWLNIHCLKHTLHIRSTVTVTLHKTMHNVTTVHNNPPRRESQSAWKTVTVTIKSNWQVCFAQEPPHLIRTTEGIHSDQITQPYLTFMQPFSLHSKHCISRLSQSKLVSGVFCTRSSINTGHIRHQTVQFYETKSFWQQQNYQRHQNGGYICAVFDKWKKIVTCHFGLAYRFPSVATLHITKN